MPYKKTEFLPLSNLSITFSQAFIVVRGYSQAILIQVHMNFVNSLLISGKVEKKNRKVRIWSAIRGLDMIKIRLLEAYNISH